MKGIMRNKMTVLITGALVAAGSSATMAGTITGIKVLDNGDFNSATKPIHVEILGSGAACKFMINVINKSTGEVTKLPQVAAQSLPFKRTLTNNGTLFKAGKYKIGAQVVGADSTNDTFKNSALPQCAGSAAADVEVKPVGGLGAAAAAAAQQTATQQTAALSSGGVPQPTGQQTAVQKPAADVGKPVVGTVVGTGYTTFASGTCPPGWNMQTSPDLFQKTGEITCTRSLPACPAGFVAHMDQVKGEFSCKLITPTMPCVAKAPENEWGTSFVKESATKISCVKNAAAPK